MSQTLRISGHSDDLVEVEGAISEEYTLPDSGIWEAVVSSPPTDPFYGRLIVSVSFTSAGTWAVGVAPADDNVQLPDWDIRVTNADNGYSTELVLTVPENTTITVRNPDRS